MPVRAPAVWPFRSTAMSSLARLQPRGHVGVASAAHVLEMVEGLAHAPTHGAAVVGAEGDAGDFKARAVMALEQFRQKLGGGVLVKVGRQIGQPDAVVPVPCSGG